MDSQIRQLDCAALAADSCWHTKIAWLVWGFVLLGTIIRLVGYGLCFPLWIDECMLAEHFLDRDFDGLLSPLGNNQLAPVGFLWIELAAVKLFGFSEYSLRLFPLVCGIGSLFVFRHLASRLLAGVPLVLAVACLAVAKAPIGLSANAKPYASDLLVAVTLMATAVEWLRRPDRTRWLWILAAAVPFALLFSFPAVFVVGAISMGLFASIYRRHDRNAWQPYLAFNALLVLVFAGIFAHCAGSKTDPTRMYMEDYWTQRDGFPPLQEPIRLAAWFIDTHVGDKIFCIPYGAENGGGLVSLVCCVVAGVVIFRRGQRPVLMISMAMFGLTFLAAAMHWYPYAGHVRLVQYLMPAISLAMGLGTATVLDRMRHPRLRHATTWGWMLGLGLFACGVCGRDIVRPYHFADDDYHRTFARNFWRSEPDIVTVCSIADLGHDLGPEGWDYHYRCNQQIYSPAHHAGRRLPAEEVKRLQQPFRLVVYREPDSKGDPPALADFLREIAFDYEPAGRECYKMPKVEGEFDMYGSYEVFRFVPRESSPFSPGSDPDFRIRTIASQPEAKIHGLVLQEKKPTHDMADETRIP